MKQITLNFDLPEIQEITEREYWDGIANGRTVEPLKKACGDCAIETGFYLPLAEGLKRQPKEVQDKVADVWFCHNACNRGCRGLRDFLDHPVKKITS